MTEPLRPALHFTPPTAWLNDPHGICWVDGTYHLFYQHHPFGTEWLPQQHWGHAVGPDLVRWRPQPIALTPHPGEEGCWTGTTVVVDGVPTIFYTSVPADNWNAGRIAVARPDPALLTWTSTEADVVIAGPPEALRATAFRDPCIFRFGDSWRMIVGVAVAGGDGLAVQYVSDDLRTWSYDGVLARRSTAEQDGTWTGELWECPQLFQVGDDWVLCVSVWDAEVLHYVAAAVGSYDGHTFTPERWSRLTHDPISYAMTSFRDRNDDPAVMFWLREEGDPDPVARSWAGALSIPMSVAVRGDRTVRLEPHDDLTRLRGRQLPRETPIGRGTDRMTVEQAHLGLDVVVRPKATGCTVEVTVGESEPALRIRIRPGVSVVERPGRAVQVVPCPADRVRIVVDAGIVEVFGGDGVGAFRFEPAGPATLSVSGSIDSLEAFRIDSVPS